MPTHLPVWKKTALGTPIELHASEPLAELLAKRPILLIGGVHGDEPEGIRLAKETLTWLLSWPKNNIGAEKALCPWIVVPCLNVDGAAKNTRVNGRGVDLNRNYPSLDWTKEAKAERYFPGPSPASEPETRAIVEIIANYSPRLVIHCHSWKPMIVGTGDLAKMDADRLAKSSGYESVDEIGYPTPGSLSRYGWHDNGVPIICIEEQDELTDLSPIWPRFEAGMKEIFLDHSMRGSK
ncbi:MAG: M14 family zinc carboxypeptidase [Bdellovibrionota bacterium]